jgi:uncharacterized membrane protein
VIAASVESDEWEAAMCGRRKVIALAFLLLVGAGCRGEPAPGTLPPAAAEADADTGMAAGVTAGADTADAARPEGERPEWDSDRARAIWAEARARGVTFRGVGQEPGWHLELFEGDSMVFVTDYGERRVSAAWPVPRIEAATGRVLLEGRAAANGPLAVGLERRPCHDSMSGQPFEFTVAVTLDGIVHDGCGRQL